MVTCKTLVTRLVARSTLDLPQYDYQQRGEYHSCPLMQHVIGRMDAEKFGSIHCNQGKANTAQVFRSHSLSQQQLNSFSTEELQTALQAVRSFNKASSYERLSSYRSACAHHAGVRSASTCLADRLLGHHPAVDAGGV